MSEAGLLPQAAFESVSRVRAAADIASVVASADLVFEAVPEQIEIKRAVLEACDAHAPAEAIIATNTSSLPIDDLAAFVKRKERFLGMHWFNPPEWTPAVEVIPSAQTDPVIVSRAREFLLAIGKKPATVASGPGFVANRIQFALFREALACVEDGLATPAKKSMKWCAAVLASGCRFTVPSKMPIWRAWMSMPVSWMCFRKDWAPTG